MHRIRLTAIAVSAVAGAAAVVASSATALPEYSVSSTFVGTSGMSTLALKGLVITCTADTNSGGVTGKASSGTSKVESTGCASGSGAKCKSENAAKSGLIVSGGTTTLGYISKAAKTVGALLKLETVKIDCGEGVLLAEVKDRLICPVTPVNADTTSYTLKCEVTEAGQTPKKFETSEDKEFLEGSVGGGTFSEATLRTEEKLTNATLGEIKA